MMTTKMTRCGVVPCLIFCPASARVSDIYKYLKNVSLINKRIVLLRLCVFGILVLGEHVWRGGRCATRDGVSLFPFQRTTGSPAPEGGRQESRGPAQAGLDIVRAETHYMSTSVYIKIKQDLRAKGRSYVSSEVGLHLVGTGGGTDCLERTWIKQCITMTGGQPWWGPESWHGGRPGGRSGKSRARCANHNRCKSRGTMPGSSRLVSLYTGSAFGARWHQMASDAILQATKPP